MANPSVTELYVLVGLNGWNGYGTQAARMLSERTRPSVRCSKNIPMFLEPGGETPNEFTWWPQRDSCAGRTGLEFQHSRGGDPLIGTPHDSPFVAGARNRRNRLAPPSSWTSSQYDPAESGPGGLPLTSIRENEAGIDMGILMGIWESGWVSQAGAGPIGSEPGPNDSRESQ
jgi:hypothetical protein